MIRTSETVVTLLAFSALTLVAPPAQAGTYYCQSPKGTRRIQAPSEDDARRLVGIYITDPRGPIFCRDETPAVPVAEARPQSTGPFGQLIKMNDYFNAIYARDLNLIRSLDDQYLGAQLRELKGGMGLGNNPIWRKMIEGMNLETASLVNTTISQYMLGYDRLYKACLKPDAVAFTITTERRNGYGKVLESRDVEYSVPREFAQAFQETSPRGERNGLAELRDAAPDSVIYAIRTGVTGIQRDFRCSDPVVKQFETSLLEMYAARKSAK